MWFAIIVPIAVVSSLSFDNNIDVERRWKMEEEERILDFVPSVVCGELPKFGVFSSLWVHVAGETQFLSLERLETQRELFTNIDDEEGTHSKFGVSLLLPSNYL